MKNIVVQILIALLNKLEPNALKPRCKVCDFKGCSFCNPMAVDQSMAIIAKAFNKKSKPTSEYVGLVFPKDLKRINRKPSKKRIK